MRTGTKVTTRGAALTASLGAAAVLAAAAISAAPAGPTALAATTSGAASMTAASSAAAPATSAVPPGGPVPAGFRVSSMTFVSASDGWVLGTTKTCAHAPCTSVLRTTNGGRSWVGIPAPKFRLISGTSSAGLIRMRFADSLDGFAYGSQLWATHNGGSTWRHVRQLPGYITDLETSAGVVYAVTTNTGTSKQRVYSSRAGTNSWHRVSGLPVTSGYSGPGTITLHGTAAWIILGGRLYASQTGSSWTKEPFRCPAHLSIASIGAYSSQQITLLCTGLVALGSTAKVVYASSNGGATFTRRGTPSQAGDGGLLAEATPRHLFLASSSGANFIYGSRNGGRTWHNSLFLTGGTGWNDFGFTTATQGVAVEGYPTIGSHLWITYNAGRSWHKVKF